MKKNGYNRDLYYYYYNDDNNVIRINNFNHDKICIDGKKYKQYKNTNETLSIMENYYNNMFYIYSKAENNSNEKINLLNKLKNEIRQNYADGICTHDTMIKYENKIDREIKYIYDKAKIRMASKELDELLDSIEKRIGGR